MFCVLISRLHEEEKTLQVLESAKPKAASPAEPGSTDPAGQSCPEEADEAEHKAGAGRTLIETTFGGSLITGIRCMQCNCISEKEEPFTDLSLAFCPTSAGPQDGPQPVGPSEEPRGLCQGSVNGGSELPDASSAQAAAGGAHPHIRAAHEPPLSVPDLVNYFLAPEILDNENAYFCDKCGSLQRAERTMKLVSAPQYLILTLLRFSYDAKCHVRRKILENVTIPPLMRLPVHAVTSSSSSSAPTRCSSATSSPLQVDSPESSENLAKKLKPSQKDEEEEEETKERADVAEQVNGGEAAVQSVPYVLSSVVMHSGVSSESGHYYSYGRNINGADGAQHPACHFALKEEVGGGPAAGGLSSCSALTLPPQQAGALASGSQEAKDWLLFNDSRVTFSSFQSVQNITNRFPKDTAYVLMYRRQEAAGQSVGGLTANGLRAGAEPPLQKELLDAIIKDNKLYLQVRGRQQAAAQTPSLPLTSGAIK